MTQAWLEPLEILSQLRNTTHFLPGAGGRYVILSIPVYIYCKNL